jgi:curved DNA-binding protein CbpA
MAKKKNYYEVLEVSRTASFETIKASYRKLALRLHPDKNKARNATRAFQRLGRAWETLKDEEKRAKYDSRLRREARWAQEWYKQYLSHLWWCQYRTVDFSSLDDAAAWSHIRIQEWFFENGAIEGCNSRKELDRMTKWLWDEREVWKVWKEFKEMKEQKAKSKSKQQIDTANELEAATPADDTPSKTTSSETTPPDASPAEACPSKIAAPEATATETRPSEATQQSQALVSMEEACHSGIKSLKLE